MMSQHGRSWCSQLHIENNEACTAPFAQAVKTDEKPLPCAAGPGPPPRAVFAWLGWRSARSCSRPALFWLDGTQRSEARKKIDPQRTYFRQVPSSCVILRLVFSVLGKARIQVP